MCIFNLVNNLFCLITAATILPDAHILNTLPHLLYCLMVIRKGSYIMVNETQWVSRILSKECISQCVVNWHSLSYKSCGFAYMFYFAFFFFFFYMTTCKLQACLCILTDVVGVLLHDVRLEQVISQDEGPLLDRVQQHGGGPQLLACAQLPPSRLGLRL